MILKVSKTVGHVITSIWVLTLFGMLYGFAKLLEYGLNNYLWWTGLLLPLLLAAQVVLIFVFGFKVFAPIVTIVVNYLQKYNLIKKVE